VHERLAIHARFSLPTVTVDRQCSLSPAGNFDIVQVSLDGTGPSLLVRFDDRERRGYRSFFSTDGNTIYVTVGRHEADIWVMGLKKK